MHIRANKFALVTIVALFALLLSLLGAKVFRASAQEIQFGGIPLTYSNSFKDGESSQVEFSGMIEAMNVQSWTIGGQVVTIQTGTEIKGMFAIGDLVKVHAFRGGNGSLNALEIEATQVMTNENGNANTNEAFEDNDNENENEAEENGNANINEGEDDNGNTIINKGEDNGNANVNEGHNNGNSNNHGDNGSGREDDGGNQGQDD
jgi:hypothetical protein